jgi:hypothetical protein
MGSYFSIWELDESRLPVDPKERAAAWQMFHALVQSDFDKGVLKDWGAFTGNHRGFSVLEGTSIEIGLMQQQYVPYVKFTTHHFERLDVNTELVNAMLE